MAICPDVERQLFFKEVDNCYWNPKLVVKVLPNGDRTVVTTAFIKDDEPLVILNHGACFGNDKCFEYSQEDLTDLNKSLVIPAYLYQFYTGHTTKFPFGYDHYFNALPTYEWYAKNHELLKVYLTISQKQKDQLKENLFLIRQLDEFIDWVKQIPNHKPNIEEAIRAVLASATRSWSSVGLVPWIDFFNHSYDGSILSNEGTTINATHNYQKGDEVNTSYGLKDSLQLLSIYGYSSDEKTIAITRPPLSPFAIALDTDLRGYQAFSEEHPFLMNESLNNFDYFIAHFRLCALSKYDSLFVKDLATEYKKWINAENELNAVKVALICLRETKKHLEGIQEKLGNVSKDLPRAFRDDFQAKFNILEKLHEKLYKHWFKIIDND